MRILEALWWLFFWTALGLCIGSFLNAVIYRLPRLGSLRHPRWSACPCCGHRIRWFDNLPLISFVLLRGRCRSCGLPISTRYPVVEATMALIVLMLLDAFFIGRMREGFRRFALTEDLAHDWPVMVAHVILFACLFSMAAIDLEHYWVDVRFTNFAALAGFVLHAIWTPRHETEWIRPGPGLVVASLFALAGLLVTFLLRACRAPVEGDHLLQNPDETDAGEGLHAVGPTAPADAQRPSFLLPLPHAYDSPSRLLGWLGGMILAALLVGLFLEQADIVSIRHAPRAVVPLLFFFLLIVAQSAVSRDSDHQIIEAIEEERFDARRTALAELAMLLPAILLGLGGVWLIRAHPELAQAVEKALYTSVGSWGGPDFFKDWAPLLGVSTAASGFVIGGAIGWFVRIFFTLVFGKEALGLGDIHIMAAAGCVAGWQVVAIGFFLTSGLALLGWLLTLPFKRTRALPLGPWLALSFLAVVVFYEPVVESRLIQNVVFVTRTVF